MGCCVVPTKFAAWIYYFGFLVVTIIEWILRDYGDDALDFGPAQGCMQTETCGELAVLRISFGSVLFFAVMTLLTLGVTTLSNPRSPIHFGFWPLKFLVWGGVIACTFAMPDDTFKVYQYIARGMSALFILLQLVIFLDVIYQLNEYLLAREQCAFALISITALCIVGTIVGMGFLYKYWAPNTSCGLNIFFITFTFILFLVYGGISVSPLRVESAGLMTSATVLAYCMYYTWSALQSEPRFNSDGTPRQCAPSGTGGNNAVRIISFIFVMLAVGLTTTNSGRSSSSFSVLAPTRKEDDADAGDDDDHLKYRPDFFYLTFMLASSYVGMVLTGWGINLEQQGEFELDKGWGSVWAKMAASWVCAAMYCWSLVAHRVLSHRDF